MADDDVHDAGEETQRSTREGAEQAKALSSVTDNVRALRRVWRTVQAPLLPPCLCHAH
jgi:hypothetical protein